MNGTRSPITPAKGFQSLATWTLEDKNEQFKLEIEKRAQQNINRTNEEKLESLKIKPKDSHDKELDKGRTKKVKPKKSWSVGPNYFQRRNHTELVDGFKVRKLVVI
jgi:N-acetylmuramoyl-L-alanine amidase CwlA